MRHPTAHLCSGWLEELEAYVSLSYCIEFPFLSQLCITMPNAYCYLIVVHILLFIFHDISKPFICWIAQFMAIQSNWGSEQESGVSLAKNHGSWGPCTPLFQAESTELPNLLRTPFAQKACEPFRAVFNNSAQSCLTMGLLGDPLPQPDLQVFQGSELRSILDEAINFESSSIEAILLVQWFFSNLSSEFFR